jgi:tetratricopeptide (TPR) repeat protein
MRYSNPFHQLAALGVMAALATGASGALAQDPFLLASDTGNAKQPLAVVESPLPTPIGEYSRLTPEDVGDAMMVHQRYQAAIEAYRQASQDAPGVWNKMGIAHQMMFNLQEASRCYQVSLTLDPSNPHVLNNLGTVYESQKRYGDAERMYRRAIRLAPGSALVYKNLGTALLIQRNYKKGWEAYETALSLDPQIFLDRTSPKVQDPGSAQDRGAMNYYMARGCVRAGMSDCAIDYLRRALNEGFTNEKKIGADAEFAGLRGIPAFEQLLAAQRKP